VECCEGLIEIGNTYPEDHTCHVLFGNFPLCSACCDENCDDWENSCNCPEDCGPCVEEGGTIPVIPDPPVCCLGLELIPPMDPNWFGIHGYCTANCGDGVCDPEIETSYNCPEDCPCVGEGGSIPVIPYPPECCPGLELIPPMCPGWLGIHGYCTANCGDGVCDPEIETDYNCPEDCPAGGPGGATTYCFSGCGELGHGPQTCTMFHADSGESFAVGNTGGFWIGDYVYVAGLVVEDSLLCWPPVVPAVEDNAISACFAGCGVLGRGPQNCSIVFHADSGGTFTLDNVGSFTLGDRVYVTGAVNEDSMDCWPVTTPAIEDNTIRSCPTGYDVLQAEIWPQARSEPEPPRVVTVIR